MSGLGCLSKRMLRKVSHGTRACWMILRKIQVLGWEFLRSTNDPVIECLGKCYVEGKKIEMELKLSGVKKNKLIQLTLWL